MKLQCRGNGWGSLYIGGEEVVFSYLTNAPLDVVNLLIYFAENPEAKGSKKIEIKLDAESYQSLLQFDKGKVKLYTNHNPNDLYKPLEDWVTYYENEYSFDGFLEKLYEDLDSQIEDWKKFFLHEKTADLFVQRMNLASEFYGISNQEEIEYRLISAEYDKENRDVIIRIPIDLTKFAIEGYEEAEFEILDIDSMAQYIVNEVVFFDEAEDGSSRLTSLLDDLLCQAYETGEEWIIDHTFDEGTE